jgi:hypothetical protein
MVENRLELRENISAELWIHDLALNDVDILARGPSITPRLISSSIFQQPQ